MKKYIACFRCGFLDGCASRGYFITRMLGNFIQAVVLYYVWKSVFAYHTTINGFTWQLMKRYVFAAFLCSNVFSMGFEMETAQRIIDFTSGSCYAINGNLQKISHYIFIITPAIVDISGDFQEILSGSFDVPINNGI